MILSDHCTVRLDRLSEYDISIRDVVEMAYECYLTNEQTNKVGNAQKIWRFEPKEDLDKVGDPIWGITATDVWDKDTKHNNFISNSDQLGEYLADVIAEISLDYSLSFELLSDKTDRITVDRIEQGNTWITY